MNRSKKTAYSIGAILSVTGFAKVSFAALLGVLLSFPVVSYNGTGSLNYSTGTDLFTISASPITVRLSNVSPPRLINPTGFPPAEVVSITVQVDNTGALTGGAPGDDLQIVGEVDVDGDTIVDYAGILLTGEVAQFGHLDTGTPTDRYDFRFFLTGGLLAPYFAGQDIGVLVTSEGSNFIGDFNLDISGGAKGNVGGIPKINHPPLCSVNGPYEAECAGNVTSIQLDGSQSSDQDNDVLTYSWTSDCPGATFDDANSASPILTIPTSGCNVSCHVSLTVSDGHDTSAPCTAMVTVSDTNAPSITCDPVELTVACTDSTDTDPPTVHDDCDPNPSLTHDDVVTPGDCAQAKTIVRTWTATDGCNNSASCTQTIHVIDNVAPVITCPADKSVTCQQGYAPGTCGSATAIDNCDPSPVVTFEDVSNPGTCPVAAVITRTWTATDACGNSSSCVQTITVRDTSAPTIVCPPNKCISCEDSKNPSNTGYPTVTDSCDPHPAVCYRDSVCGTCPKVITRRWTATDACGNYSCCTQYITIYDHTAPVITCPPEITIDCGDSTSPSCTGRATARDNCDSCVDITYCDSSNGCGCPRTITRTWKAKDDCCNVSTCVQIIHVQPKYTCPRSPGYWKNHRSQWPVSSIIVGGDAYNATQIMNLLSNKKPNGQASNGDMSSSLAKFVISAQFNILNGADPQNIDTVLDAADAFLDAKPPGSCPTGSAKQTATQLQDRLDTYCNSTPPGCDDDCTYDGNRTGCTSWHRHRSYCRH